MSSGTNKHAHLIVTFADENKNNLKRIIMVTTRLNPMQLNVLSLMSYIDTEQEQKDLQDILLQFYRVKADNLLRQFQKEKGITQETLDEWSNQHERTPY